MIAFRDLKTQYEALADRIDSAVLATCASGHYIGGATVTALEEELASYAGTTHCITCGNGTDALQLALMAWGLGSGDAVFVPDFTFFASGEVVSAVGATPVFVDVDPVTFNIDPPNLAQAIREVSEAGELIPRAVIAVDLFGLPANYREIRAICDEYGLLLLEDAAQGFGGMHDGRRACSFGDISTTSFFPAKPLGCYGDGGAVFTNNDEWAELVRSFAVHGKGSMKYDNVRIGMNSRLDAIQAAILQVKLSAFVEHELDDVNERASWYNEAFGTRGLPGRGITLPIVPEGSMSSWAQYTLVLSNPAIRNTLQTMLREQGIPTMVYYPKPMHEQLAFAGSCVLPAAGCPATERLCASVLSLPMGPYLTREDLETVASTLDRALSNVLP